MTEYRKFFIIGIFHVQVYKCEGHNFCGNIKMCYDDIILNDCKVQFLCHFVHNAITLWGVITLPRSLFSSQIVANQIYY